MWRVLEEDFEIGSYGIEPFMELSDGEGSPVSLQLTGADLRTGLNTLVRQIPEAYWDISGRPGRYFLTIASVG